LGGSLFFAIYAQLDIMTGLAKHMKNIITKKNRVLLSELVKTDFKLRYQGSVLGYAWSLLRPLMLFLILYIVFVKFLKLGGNIPHYPIYLLLGIVMWSFFAEMTSLSLGSIVGRGDLIRKIRIPRWIIVLSSSVTAVINLGLNLMVVLVFLLLNNVDITKSILLLPFILIQLYIFSLGVSLILATAFVKYRDITHIWEVALQGLFYLTPILYPLSIITRPLYQKLLLINPVASAIQNARYVVVTKDSITIGHLFSGQAAQFLPIIISVIMLIVGVLYFKKEAKSFAEDL
jgi:ABC-2 type transport system permease protein